MDYIISESQLRSIVESENTESDKLFKIVSRIIGEGEYSEKYGLYEHDIASVKLRYKVNTKTSLWFETVEYDGVQRKNITGTIYLSIDGIIRSFNVPFEYLHVPIAEDYEKYYATPNFGEVTNARL